MGKMKDSYLDQQEELHNQDQERENEQPQPQVPNLVKIFYDHFDKPREYDTENITFAPSYLSACVRQTYYKKTNTKPSNPITLPAYFKMEMGTMVHEGLQAILSEHGLLKSAEEHKQIEWNGLTFNYYYDGIMEFGCYEYLMEIKTIYGAGFRFIEKDGAKPEHIIQAISYMKFEQINRCIIIYVGRDNGFMLQFYLELVDDKLHVDGKETDFVKKWHERIEKMQLLKSQIDAQTVLPEREYSIVIKNNGGIITEQFQKDNVKHKSDWQCSYCAFKDKCWAKEYKDILNHKFFINSKFE